MESNKNKRSSDSNKQYSLQYQQINFYNNSTKNRTSKPIWTNNVVDQSQNIKNISDNQNLHLPPCSIQPLNHQNEQEQVYVESHPFYIGEVDHNIEEIGIMAVRQVRYVDDKEWEEMLKQQKKYNQALKKNKMEHVRVSRKIQAQKRKRNQKGQFVPQKEQAKNLQNKDINKEQIQYDKNKKRIKEKKIKKKELKIKMPTQRLQEYQEQ